VKLLYCKDSNNLLKSLNDKWIAAVASSSFAMTRRKKLAIYSIKNVKKCSINYCATLMVIGDVLA